LLQVWISPNGGLADDYVQWIQGLSSNPEFVIVALLGIFALAHSGLAYLRPAGGGAALDFQTNMSPLPPYSTVSAHSAASPQPDVWMPRRTQFPSSCVVLGSDAAALVPNPAAEELIGARAFRVIFALVSLPLAVVAVVYFINHRYSGTPLWNLRGLPLVHESVWGLSFISFFFLYPSTFNLLEVGRLRTTSSLHISCQCHCDSVMLCIGFYAHGARHPPASHLL